MKKITITKASGEHTIIHDDDDSDIVEYSKKLSELMSASNVSLLETSERVVIIRPHKIEAIDVIEVLSKDESKDDETDQDKDIDSITEDVEEHIDIIKDANTGDD